MTVTSNLSLIHNCEDTTDWVGDPTIGANGEVARVGSNAVGFDVDSETEADVYLDINSIFAGDQDMSDWTVYLWFMYLGAPQNLGATYGLRVGLYDGATTGWFHVNNATSYPGGWVRYAIDCSEAFDSGSATKTTIARMYLSGTATVKSKLPENFLFDQIEYMDQGADSYAIEVTDGTVGTPLTWADLVTDQGIVDLRGGVYYINGPIQFGDAGGADDLYFDDTNQIVLFEEQWVIGANHYTILITGNVATTTSFILGEESGTQGINGCYLKALDSTSPIVLTATSTDIDALGIYGCTIINAGVWDIAAKAALEFKTDVFITQQGQFQPNIATVDYCSFISALASLDSAVLMESTSHNMTFNNYIDCDEAIEITTAATHTLISDQFTGCTSDINNTSGSSITVQNSGTPVSNASTYTGSTVTFDTAVWLRIYVYDKDTEVAIENVQCSIWKTSDDSQLMNEDSTAAGLAEQAYTYPGSPVPCYYRCRKTSPGAQRYHSASGTGSITADGYTLQLLLEKDNIATT